RPEARALRRLHHADVLQAAVREAGRQSAAGAAGGRDEADPRREGGAAALRLPVGADSPADVPQGPAPARPLHARTLRRSVRGPGGRRPGRRAGGAGEVQSSRAGRRAHAEGHGRPGQGTEGGEGEARGGARLARAEAARRLLHEAERLRLLLHAAGRRQRRLSRRPDLRRQPRLRRLAARRLPGRPARLHAAGADERPARQARAGARADAAHEPRRAAGPRHPAARRHPGDWAVIRERAVDVVTVGAGLTATMLAAKLCEAGYEVRSLEQGATRWTYPEFAHDHDSLRYSVRYAMMVDLARESWTWRPDTKSPALPMRQYGSFNPGEGLGGAMVHWSAQLWRFLETDFRHRSHVIERYGAAKLPEGSTVQDWPIT